MAQDTDPNTPPIIRSFMAADAEAFRRLNMAWITAHFRLEDKDEAALNDPVGTILAPGGQIFMAVADDQAVGCVALLPHPGGGYEVAKMAVAEERRGQGLGRRLLEAAIQWARAQGARRLYLESNARLTPALRLYESAGFRHLPPGAAPPSPYARADVFMELLLDAE